MAYPCLPLALALVAFTVGAEPDRGSSTELEPCTNGGASSIGCLPNQTKEDAYESDLRWTKQRHLNPPVGLESLIHSGADAGRLLPVRSMTEQLGGDRCWVEEEELRPF